MRNGALVICLDTQLSNHLFLLSANSEVDFIMWFEIQCQQDLSLEAILPINVDFETLGG